MSICKEGIESVTWMDIGGRRSIDNGYSWRHRIFSPRPRPQSKVTSHALTARGTTDGGLVLIEKSLEGAIFEF
jgi:hypothetical protein